MDARHFPQFTLNRLEAALGRLREAIWHSPEPVHLAKAADSVQPVPLHSLRPSSFHSVTAPLKWGRLFHYTWFRVVLPEASGKRGRYLRWREQGEAILYVNDLPHFGFDPAHRCAPLPHDVRTVFVESMCCQSGIWHPEATGLDPGGSCLSGCEVVQRDDEAWHAWHDLVVLKEVLVAQISQLPEADAHLSLRPGVRPPFRKLPAWVRSLLASIDLALDRWERRDIRALRAALRRLYREFPAEWHQLSASLIGHAHIDLVWMWPERTGETKAVHTFASVLRLMETYPEFRFSYSQPASYEAVTRLAPGLIEIVRSRIRQKRWEVLGAAYVESDTVLPCGEALLRSLLVGQKARLQWVDRPSRILWLPDVFGYAGCLPRMMAMAGIDFFFTNKVAWRRLTHFPHSGFRWRGTDGTEVLAHVSFEIHQCYNGTATVKELQDSASTQQQAHLHPESLVPTGYGDGGGGPTEEMCERARRMADLVSVPRAEWGMVEPFFERLDRVRDQLPVWSGEIYLQMHRGTYTSHASMKAAYRAAERGLQTWEAAHCVSRQGGIREDVWKRLIFAQFHDALPGSSFHEVYAELVPELSRLADRSRQEAVRSLTRRDGEPCLFNPLPQAVHEVVTLGDGRKVRVLLPALSGVKVAGLCPAPETSPVRVGPYRLENGRVSVRFSSSGEIEALAVDGTDVELTEPGGQLWIYPDHPHDFAAWELDHESLRMGSRVRRGERTSRTGDGEVEGAIEFVRPLPDEAGRVRLVYRLRSGEPYIRVACEVEWRKPQSLLRWVFPTAYQGRLARFAAPFGSVLRPQLPGRSEDESYWESPASRWAMVTDDGESDGLYVITEAKYGFEVFSGRLAVTLLRSAFQTGEETKFAGAAPGELRDPDRSAFTDLGVHRIELAFGRFQPASSRHELPASLADSLFTGPVSYRGRPMAAGLVGLKGGESVVPAWARPLDRDRWLLRLHETLGRRGELEIVLQPGHSLESVEPGDVPGRRVPNRFLFEPYGIQSFIVRRPARLRRSRG